MLGPRKKKAPEEDFNVSYDRFGRRKFTLIEKQPSGVAPPPPPPGPPPNHLPALKPERKEGGQASNKNEDFKAPLNKRSSKTQQQKSHLQAREEDLELDKLMGKTTIVDPNAEKRDQGAFYCELCDCALHDSQAYVEHLNGKYHNRRKGMTMRVERLGIDRIKEKLKNLKQNQDKPSKPSFEYLPRQSQNQLNQQNSLEFEVEIQEENFQKNIPKPPSPVGPPPGLRPIPPKVETKISTTPLVPTAGMKAKPPPPPGPPPSHKKPPPPPGPPPFLKNLPPPPLGPPPGFPQLKVQQNEIQQPKQNQEEENEDLEMEGFGFSGFGKQRKK